MTFKYSKIFPLSKDKTKYKKIKNDFVSRKKFLNKEFLFIKQEAIELLTEKAFSDISHLYRESHLKQLEKILKDPEASENDKFVAQTMLENAVVSSSRVLPMCQDTGTAIIIGFKGENVFTGVDDKKVISKGVYNAYQKLNLR